jgi:O-antigen/teichoic acid export membrane protein
VPVPTLDSLRQFLDRHLRAEGQADAGVARRARVLRGAISAALARGLGMLVTLVTVPLTVGYLGAERYGAWMTISATLAWLFLADLGIGNGLTNALAHATAIGDQAAARRHVATALWLLAGIAGALVAVSAFALPSVDWQAVFNVHSAAARAEIGPSVVLAILFFALSFPLSLVEKIFTARQEGTTANGWAAAANLASLVAVIVATRVNGGLPLLVAALGGTRLLVQLASALWLFARHAPGLAPRPSAVDRGDARRLLTSGGLFFLVQMAALVIYNTDNLIITRVLGAEHVTPYSVAWSLFSIPTMAVTLLLPYLWPAYVAALAQGDVAWVKRAFKMSLVAGLAVTTAVAVPLYFASERIIALWAGPTAAPPHGLLPWMAVWSVVLAPMQSAACLLNAAGRLRGQAIYGTSAALANFALSIRLARSHGITGVIAATVIALTLFAVIPSALESALFLRNLGHRRGA